MIVPEGLPPSPPMLAMKTPKISGRPWYLVLAHIHLENGNKQNGYAIAPVMTGLR